MVLYFIVYQVVQVLTLPLFVGYIILRKFKKKPVFGNFWQRMGFVPKTTGNGPVIWLHAVSVGEVLSIQAFIEKIKQTTPNTICYLTVGTPTGKQIAQEKLNADYVSFLPYDFLKPMLLAFKRIKPTTLFIVEAELWPNLLMIAHYKKVPIHLLNARISKRSKKRYHAYKRFLLPLFDLFEMIYTQSAYDKDEFRALGVTQEKLRVLGDMKAYNVLEKVKKVETISPTSEKPTLLVGSLHPGELDIYLTLFKKLKKAHPSLRLILAPRHFHWQTALIEHVKKTGYSYAVWENENEPAFAGSCDILLVCKLGELFTLYQQATIYFLGGTFVPIGGHNLLEPAVWAKPIIIGPHHHNCQVAASQLQAHKALVVANDEHALEHEVVRLLANPQARDVMGTHARAWLEDAGAVVERNLDALVDV